MNEENVKDILSDDKSNVMLSHIFYLFYKNLKNHLSK